MTFRTTLISLVVASLLGCSSGNRTDYVDQAQISNEQAVEQLVSKLVDEQSPSDEPLQAITDLVNIPALAPYLAAAMENNPSLQQSIVALKMAYAQHGITAADQWPTLSAGLSGEQTEGSDESYTGELNVSWELDIWRQLADSSAAAQKDIAATQASLQAAKDLLAANVMRGWLEISVNKQLLDIEQRRLDILENNEVLVLERYKVGLGSLEELDSAKTNSSSTRATVAEYRENLAQSQRNLALLTGLRAPQLSVDEVPAVFATVLNPLDSLGVQNMAGRPDLQQAFYNIEAEALRTDAAYKAMLPSFSLSASLTDLAQTPSEALLTNPVWSVLGQISAPLFQGGKLKSQAELAELTTEQTYWVYQQTLLDTVSEVETAVGQEHALEKQQQHLESALQSARRSVESYEQKYREGLVDIFDLLTVQQQAYDIEAQLTSATYQRLLNRIDLGLALGLGVS